MLTERVSHHLISTNTPDQGQTTHTHKHEDREGDRVDTSNKKGGSNLGQIRPELWEVQGGVGNGESDYTSDHHSSTIIDLRKGDHGIKNIKYLSDVLAR